MDSHPLLREEAFCQVIKQTTSNKREASNIWGWKLMYILALCIVPSVSLVRIVKTHLCTEGNARDYGLCGYQNVHDLASLSLKFMDRELRFRVS